MTLSGCDGLTDKGLAYVARYFGESLETLSVSGCKVSAANIVAIARRLLLRPF